MFACLYSLSASTSTLVKIAEDFTPRFEVVGPLVMLDVSGLSRLFGSPREIGEQLRQTAARLTRDAEGSGGKPVHIALAPTQTAAALLTLGRVGLTVVMPDEEAEKLASLPVTLLGDFDRLRLAPATSAALRTAPAPVHRTAPGAPLAPDAPAHGTAPDAPLAPVAPVSGGWKHPRDSHAANATRQARHAVSGTQQLPSVTRPASVPRSTPRTQQAALADIQSLLDTLKRWGVRTMSAFAALPSGDVYERLGPRGVFWQHLARGSDRRPLVPWVPEDPFEGVLELEWPIEGLEPLSFVLSRLFEPLAERLERADRGAAVLHTHLRLVSKEVHARTLQLPAPMRDPKTLRTLVLLDLETNPPSAGIDRVRVLIEPTPARVTQWKLFDRAQPSPEQVSTLLARLTALMGESHVGSPRLLDTWKPGAFEMVPFHVQNAHHSEPRAVTASGGEGGNSALRRLRLPIPARVQVVDGRPVRVATDRRGITSGAIVQAAGPWRTSGEWWTDALSHPSHPSHPSHLPHPSTAPHPSHPSHPTHLPHPSCWDRDEWDVALADGTVYRLFVERAMGQWFIEGVVD
jgi:protein ImuB